MLLATFYVANGTLVDKAIRLRTSGRTSHCELFIPTKGSMSSSYRDSGVRLLKDLRPVYDSHWEVLNLSGIFSEQSVATFFERTEGLPYDLKGVLLGQTLTANVEDRKKFFCSEWCAAALGFVDPWRYSPQLLYNVLLEILKSREGKNEQGR